VIFSISTVIPGKEEEFWNFRISGTYVHLSEGNFNAAA
jgi:hypothetical protein